MTLIITVKMAIANPYESVKSYTYESKNPIASANGSNIANFYQISYIMDYRLQPSLKQQEWF